MPRPERKLPPVYLCETGHDGASCRLKWLASTCLAGMVGVCLIGVAIYASLNMGDGSGMMSSLKRASLAALQPMRGATLAKNGQSANGQKEDRIQMTAAGFVSRQVIHDTVIERQGSREFITIKPYLRIVAGLATELPADANELPPFNPFKLYSDQTPVGAGGAANDAPQAVSVNVVDMPGGILPQTDGVELRQDEVNQLVAEAAENFAYADGATDTTGSIGEGGARLLQAAYHPDDATGLGTAPHMTVIQKSADDAAADDEDEFDDDMFAGAENKTMIVGRGDTLQSLFTKAGTEPSEADDIIEALSPIFGAKDLKSGQELRFTLVPAPSDTGQMEPVKVSVFLKGEPPRHRRAQPAGRICRLGAGHRQRRQDPARPGPRHALHQLLSRGDRATRSGRDHPQAAARAFLRRRLQAEGQGRRHGRDVLRWRQRRRSGRAALHLDDHRRQAAQILSLPHPRRRGRLLRRAGQQREEVPDAQSGQRRPFHFAASANGAIRCSRSCACIPASTGPRPPARRSSPPATAPSSRSAAKAATATMCASATPTATPPPTATCRAMPTASRRASP